MKNKNTCKNLFVYGTLQKGQSRNHILRNLDFKKCYLEKYRKIKPKNLGFPFIIRDEHTKVRGEVYFGLDDDLFKIIDQIESEGSLYHRILVTVVTDDGEEIDAYTYYPDKRLIKAYM